MAMMLPGTIAPTKYDKMPWKSQVKPSALMGDLVVLVIAIAKLTEAISQNKNIL